jgi:hypothetical protein
MQSPEEVAAQAAYQAAVKQAEEERRQEGEAVMAAIKTAHIGSTALGEEFAAERDAEQRKAKADAEELEKVRKATEAAEQESAYFQRRLRELKGQDK